MLEHFYFEIHVILLYIIIFSLFLYVRGVVLTGRGRGEFAPLPQGTIGNIWRHFWLKHLGARCYWHPEGSGLRFCSMSYNTQYGPLRVLWHHIHSSEVKNPVLELGKYIIIFLMCINSLYNP